MASGGSSEQVLYTDEAPKLVKKGHVYLPDKRVSPLDALGLDLEIQETLGEGPFFKVKKVYCKKRNCFLAMKVFCKLKATEIVKKRFFPREVLILRKLCHDHIVGVFEVLLTNRRGIILMDYMPNGDLLTYINNEDHGHLSEAESRYLFHQLQSAVTYLHSIDIVHRDIKCDNLLLDEDFKLKLCDFGFATTCTDGQMLTEACGSMGYVAPEILEGDPYEGKPTDIWSMGVTLFAMLCGRLPYHEDSLDILFDSIYNPQEKLCFPKSVTKECRNFVHALLTPDPKERVRMRDLGQLDWMARPTAVAQPLNIMTKAANASLEMTGSEMETCKRVSSGASLDSMLRSCTNMRRQSVSFATDAEHGFAESQREKGSGKRLESVVSDVLKAVAVRHAFGESPMSVHKDLDQSIGPGPHHFTHNNIGLKGPAARRISVQLSRTNLTLDKTHIQHHPQQQSGARPMSGAKPGGGGATSGPRRASLAPRKVCWKEESHTNFTPSRKNSLLMMTANSMPVSTLRRGSLALHCGKVQPGGSSVNLSASDLAFHTQRLQEKEREHELHDIHYSMGAKIAKQAGASRHRAAETTRRNSVFTEDMKIQQMPNSLKPEEQELVNSFRSQCENIKHMMT